MNNKRPASRSSLYVLEGNPGIGKAFPYSVQQILSMFVTLEVSQEERLRE